MIGLEAPWLLFGLVALAIPILLHVTARTGLPRRRFAAISLLRAAVGVRIGRTRLRNIALLLLRLLAMAAIVLAAAHPFVSLGVSGGKGAPVTLVLVLDDSMSMRRRTADGTLFEMAVKAARSEIGRLGHGDAAALVLAGRPARAPVPDPWFELDKVSDVLAGTVPRCASTDLEKALDIANRILSRTSPLGGRIVVLSDQARHAWPRTALPWQPAVKADVKALRLPSGSGWDNRAVETVTATRVPALGPLGVRIDARIAHSGPGPVSGVACTLEIDGKDAAVRRLDLPRRGSKDVVFQHTFDTPGTFEARVRLPGDALSDDDDIRVLLNVGATLSVLVVNGDPRPGSYRDEAFYLLRALGTARDITVAAMDPQTAADAGVSGYDAVFLLNPESLPEPLIRGLETYLEGGGGLVVSLGDRTAPDAAWLRLLPFAIRGPVASPAHDPEHGVVVGPRLRDVLTGLKSSKTGLEETRVARRFVPAGPIPEGTEVFASSADGLPLLVASGRGSGRVIVWMSTFDRDWTDLPIRPGYVPLTLETVRSLSRRRAFIQHPQVRSGNRHEVRYPESAVRLVLRGPGGRVWTFPRSALSGRSALAFDDTAVPGVYRVFAERERAGVLVEMEEEAFSVRPPSGEWDLEPVPVVAAAASGSGFLSAELGDRTPLWPLFALLAVVFILAEALVAGLSLHGRKPS